MGIFVNGFVGLCVFLVGLAGYLARKTNLGQEFFEKKFGKGWERSAKGFILNWPMMVVGVVLAFPGVFTFFQDLLATCVLLVLLYGVWWFVLRKKSLKDAADLAKRTADNLKSDENKGDADANNGSTAT